jgi:Tfp pilus assembly PilM family ATPase
MNLATDFVALDIGTNCLKVFAAKPGPGGTGMVVTDCFMIDLPPGLIGGGFTNPVITDAKRLLQAFGQVGQRLTSTKGGFLVGLPDRWVKLHLLTLPLNPQDIDSEEFLGWRLKKLLPLPENAEILIDHQILAQEETPEGPRFRVLAAAVRRDLIDQLSGLMAIGHFELLGFDTSTLGVFNLLETLEPENVIDRAVVHCHVGHETTVVKAYHHGALAYERVIEVGGEEFINLVSHLEEIPVEEARKRIGASTFFPLSREDLVRLIPQQEHIEGIFGNWLRELNVTFRFYQEKFKMAKLPRLYLTGGSSLFQGLPEFLGEFFDTACSRFNPLTELPLAAPVSPGQVALGSQFAPCIGLLCW